MDAHAEKSCQSCAQPIHAEARRCQHCHARQQQAMHRNQPGKMIGGVCAALADQFGVDVAIVRVAFGVAAAVSGGLAFAVYALFWALTPAAPGVDAPAARWMDRASRLFSAPVGQPVHINPDGPSSSL